ncbi:MAG: DUF169 domain-containing protein [Promethearchaeota archaeon]
MVKSIEDYQKGGEDLFHKLHLATYPVAIKYIKDINTEIPKGYRRPIDSGKKMSICQAFTQARRFGEKLCITAADNFCTPATVGHGWVNISKEEFIESQVRQEWHKDVQSEKRRAEELYAKNFKNIIALGYHGLICSPLTETAFVPDTILIYGNGTQLTYIIHALTFEHKKKYSINSSFEGFGESCAKGGLMPFLLRKTQIVLPGAGDRSFAGIQDYELGIGMPAEHIFYLRNNLFKTGKGRGLKFPLRQLIPLGLSEKITPGFVYIRKLIDKKVNEDKFK